jgi:hypothetical protein
MSQIRVLLEGRDEHTHYDDMARSIHFLRKESRLKATINIKAVHQGRGCIVFSL